MIADEFGVQSPIKAKPTGCCGDTLLIDASKVIYLTFRGKYMLNIIILSFGGDSLIITLHLNVCPSMPMGNSELFSILISAPGLHSMLLSIKKHFHAVNDKKSCQCVMSKENTSNEKTAKNVNIGYFFFS